MEKYFEDGDLSVEDLKKGLRKATIAMAITPVLCGSSYRNKGVQFLLDAIIDYLPSPLDVDHVKGINPETGEEEERKTSDEEPFAALRLRSRRIRLSASSHSSAPIRACSSPARTSITAPSRRKSASAASCRCMQITAKRSR